MKDTNLQFQHDTPPATPAETSIQVQHGTLDGHGAGDHDQPFTGFRHYHFSTRQMLRLLLLRGDIQDSRVGPGRYSADLGAS